MLRYASCHATLRGRNCGLLALKFRERGTVRKRNHTTGIPSPKQKPQNKKSGPSAATDKNRSPLHRSGILQSIRVQTNPISEEAIETFRSRSKQQEKERPTSKKLVHLLRQGPGQASTRLRSSNGVSISRPQSALQSHLQASSKDGMTTTNIVDFFHDRLAEHKAGELQNKNNNRSRVPSTHQLRRSGNLEAAKDQVRYAENIAEHRDSTKPGPSSTIREVLVKSSSNGAETQGGSASRTTEHVSPIRQYVVELQKRNREMNQDRVNKRLDVETPEVPSWRKSMQFSGSQPYQKDLSIDHRSSSQGSAPKPKPKQKSLRQRLAAMTEIEEERQKQPSVAKIPEVVLPSHSVTVRELSRLFKVKATKIAKVLEDLGELPRAQSYAELSIDADLAEMIALELDVKFRKQTPKPKLENDYEQLMERRRRNESIDANDVDAAYESFPPRAPVVCIMGHVDHGKTTLMDALRRRSQGGSGKQKKKKSKVKKGRNKAAAAAKGDVAGTEAGGITQVVSAFQVPLGEQKDAVTFLDTPGHAAFSAMRQSGSHAADIIVLVIAADDGIQPQTVEILNLYKSIAKESEGGIAMVVAMNKIDKPGVDLEESKRRIENQLLEHEIYPEGLSVDGESDYGAPVQFFPISAKTGNGLDDLIEGLALQSEVMDLRSDVNARAEGIVMDARVEQGLGVVVDAIVRWGSIQKGDVVVSDTCVGKVRLLKDVQNNSIKSGLPSQPVRLVGFKSPPKAGDPIVCVASEQVASDLVEQRLALREQSTKENAGGPMASFSQVIVSGCESMTSMGTERRLEKYELALDQNGPIRIPVVLKASADGSVTAVRDAMQSLSKESSFDINVDTISEGVGPLTTTEIEMASESNAAIFCFDVKNQDKSILALAEAEGIKIHEFDVIYSLLDEAREVFTSYLPSLPVETIHGKAKVEAVFEISGGKDTVAGLKVLDGALHKSFVESDKTTPARFRVIRDGVRITTDVHGVQASSLKKFKDDVEKVRHGEECGISFSGAVDFKEGDLIECYSVEMKKSFAGFKETTAT